jgi:hypothetical protein
MDSCHDVAIGVCPGLKLESAQRNERFFAPSGTDLCRSLCYVWNVLTRPSFLLRAEGGVIFGASLLLYGELRGSWALFVMLVLAPDLSILGYLSSARLGAALYNLVHALVAPVLLIVLSIVYKQLWLLPYGLIWTAHIGADRLLGYGLKYPTRFHDTHLHRL